MSLQFEQGVQFLADNGLNLFALLRCDELPETLQSQLRQGNVPLDDFSHLLLTGHGGRLFWEKLQEAGMETADPVDTFSTQLTTQFIRDYLGNPPHLLLYPFGDYLVPLTQLGEWAGWSHPSPLGQGIHAHFGVWFAYRTAVLLNGSFPATPRLQNSSPCQNCVDKPCITACPAGAVQEAGFQMSPCINFRLRTHSPCADRCLARMACPVAPEHRYTLPQIQYHYGHSLAMIRQWDEEMRR